ncbi:MAG: TlpA disulfide reductase family protein [Planctomycetia bacterium]|nr:TlpA disulfide reductase family protein [Planctomycetia bacterium]
MKNGLLRCFGMRRAVSSYESGGWRGTRVLLCFAFLILLVMAFLMTVKHSDREGAGEWENFVGTQAKLGGFFLDGTECRLEDYAGKVVLLDFWATWCSPCRREVVENLIPLYEKYHEDGLEIVGISYDSDASKAIKFSQENGIRWKHLLVSGVQSNGEWLSKYYKVQSIPFTVLIGRDGKIVSVNSHGAQLEKWIQKEIQSGGGSS